MVASCEAILEVLQDRRLYLLLFVDLALLLISGRLPHGTTNFLRVLLNAPLFQRGITLSVIRRKNRRERRVMTADDLLLLAKRLVGQ